MIREDPPIPNTAVIAGAAMRELEHRGGQEGVSELHDAMRANYGAGFLTSHSWDRNLDNQVAWAMRMLRILGEIDRLPPSESEPSGSYEVLPRDPETTDAERESRREEWVRDYIKVTGRKWYDNPFPF